MNKIELLAPAGTMEKMKMALLYGADAVYLAGKVFGLRAYGGNFTKEEMKEAVLYAHGMGKKVYVTVNIIRDDKLVEKKKLSLPAQLCGVLTCRNPRCISSVEQELPQIFRLTDRAKREYRCAGFRGNC